MKVEFGLIGKKLGHSFSKDYFEKKFIKEGLKDYSYHLFEIESIDEVKHIIKKCQNLRGLNVTIPFKREVFSILNDIDENAIRIGAVNVVRIGSDGALKGYNTDYHGFRVSLQNWLPANALKPLSALVLGSGGASRSVCCVLEDLKIKFDIVSRKKEINLLTYNDLSRDPSILRNSQLIINSTPLGMYPEIETFAPLDYNLISKTHYIYDLVYNPVETLFLKKCKERGAATKNGLEMLYLQAEKSWEIWTV